MGHPGLSSADPTGRVTGRPSFAEALGFWLKLGFISFGGPTGQIAIMHTELVERKRWIDESRFLHALNYCMLLPGPEAQQLAIYIGWLLHGTRGGLVAGSLFVLPSAALLWLLSYVYVAFGHIPSLAAAFHGLKPAVIAIVAHAVFRIGKRALKNSVSWSIAGLAFVAIYFVGVPFPAIIAGAALVGLIGSTIAPTAFIVSAAHGSPRNTADIGSAQTLIPSVTTSFSWTRAMKVIVIGAALWWIPQLVAAAILGPQHAVVQEGLFFSKAAMVTFGGAYAVLPYVAQQAVERFAWLSPEQMLDGLGLAETTPGPLIMVVQFVGFLGGWNQPGALSPLLSATLGAAISTWVTFVPCFVWIFLGAPYIETLHGRKRVGAALSAVTAAVVGVVLNLAVWFAINVVCPSVDHVDWFALVIAAGSLLGLTWFRLNVMTIVLAGVVLGVLGHTIGIGA